MEEIDFADIGELQAKVDAAATNSNPAVLQAVIFVALLVISAALQNLSELAIAVAAAIFALLPIVTAISFVQLHTLAVASTAHSSKIR